MQNVDVLILSEDLLLQAQDFLVLSKRFILELLLKGVLVLISVEAEPLRGTATNLFVLPLVSLFQECRHHFVSEHLRIEDAVERAILSSFAVDTFVLLNYRNVVVFEDAEHLL